MITMLNQGVVFVALSTVMVTLASLNSFNIYRYVDQMKGEEMGLTCNTRVRDENLNRQ
jgi:hypothetical protein